MNRLIFVSLLLCASLALAIADFVDVNMDDGRWDVEDSGKSVHKRWPRYCSTRLQNLYNQLCHHSVKEDGGENEAGFLAQGETNEFLTSRGRIGKRSLHEECCHEGCSHEEVHEHC